MDDSVVERLHALEFEVSRSRELEKRVQVLEAELLEERMERKNLESFVMLLVPKK